MVFNDTTTKLGLIQECEGLIQAGSGRISGDSELLAHFTRLINNRYQDVETLILKSQDEWDFDDANYTTYPIMTTSLVANQSTYNLPTTTLKIQRLEAKLDGTNTHKAEPFDINERGLATDSTTLANEFSTSKPFYDIFARSLRIYPTPTSNVSSGLKIWILRTLNLFAATDTTKEPGIDVLWHRMIAVGASMDYAISKGLQNKNDLASLWQDYEKKLQNYYGRKQEDRVAVMKSAYIDYE